MESPSASPDTTKDDDDEKQHSDDDMEDNTFQQYMFGAQKTLVLSLIDEELGDVGSPAAGGTGQDSFPVQLRSLSQRWFHIIPGAAIVDFNSVENVIRHQESLLDGITKGDASPVTHDQVEVVYQRSHAELTRALTSATSIVSTTLLGNNATAPGNRQAYKEYADLHQRALNYLIARTNQFLERFRSQHPKMTINSDTGSSVWPIEQISIVDSFVQMSRDVSWVHHGTEIKGESRPSTVVLVDYDRFKQSALGALMALAFVFLANGGALGARFMIHSIGINNSSLTAFLLTVSWPIQVARAAAKRQQRRRHGRRLKSVAGESVLGRVVVFGGLETSSALVTALAIHSLPLHLYLVIYTMAAMLFNGSVAGRHDRLTLATMTMAVVVIVLATVHAIIDSLSVLVVLLAMLSAVLPVCLGLAKQKLFRPQTESSDDQLLRLTESDAISSTAAFGALTLILGAVGEWERISTVVAGSIPASSWPAFVAIALTIALPEVLTDFIGRQLESDLQLNLKVFRFASFVLVVAVGLGIFSESTTALSIAAVALSLGSSFADSWVNMIIDPPADPDPRAQLKLHRFNPV